MLRGDQPKLLDFLEGGGELSDRIRSFDWSSTPLGGIDLWPQSLRTSVSLMLNSQHPMWIGWGPEATFLYNDAYIQVLSLAKHPWALGRPAAEVWAEIWDVCGPLADKVFHKGQASFVDDVRLFMSRGDFLEETFYSFSYSPIRDETGRVAGLFCPSAEVTQKVLYARRLRTLSELAAGSLVQKSTQAACASAFDILARNRDDIPFALLYLIEPDGKSACLEQAVGIGKGRHQISPAVVEFSEAGVERLWPIAETAQTARPQAVLVGGVEGLPLGAAQQRVAEAVVLPMVSRGQTGPAGILVAGVNPTRKLDAEYQTFYELVAGHIATAIQNARAAEEEKRRADLLAELDRAKTTFFSNVSHEFRTPLTLMLGTMEDILGRPEPEVSTESRALAAVAHRNGMRLLKLVNTLLDFSRIEAGRVEAVFEPVDLASFTTDLASAFRSAMERAGLRFRVDCQPLPEPAFVDRDMWEKVVFNLLSNAFKFTHEGEVSIFLRSREGEATLSVRDTGIGIPAEELPEIFKRFHRIEHARGRTHEGTGIGLALVQELVRVHGGTMNVESEPGLGSTFHVRIPLGKKHLPPERIGAERTQASTALHGSAFVEEALTWLPENVTAETEPLPAQASARQRILLAEDNADMRGYLRRLLRPTYDVETVADGGAALEAARRRPPDLVLSDVMMPVMNGFELVQQIRAEQTLRHIPVILLSARAGEEARVEGVTQGADDYLTKPFSARELLARVAMHLDLARVRKSTSAAVDNERRRLHDFLMQAPAIICILRGPSHVFELVNDRYLNLTGRSDPQMLLGRAVRDALAEQEGRGYFEILDRAYSTGEPFHATEMPVTLARPGGSVDERFMNLVCQPTRDTAGEVDGIMVHAVDVTEQVRSRQQIEEFAVRLAEERDRSRESEERYRLVSRATHDVVWDWNLETDEVVWSEALHGVFGYPPEQTGTALSGAFQWWTDRIHPRDRDRVAESIRRASSEGRQEWTEEYRFLRADGSYAYVSDAALIVFDQNGRAVRMVSAMADITGRKKAEDALREADRRKDEFLATLAHELRNPLAPIRNSLHFLRLSDGAGGAERVHQIMERQVNLMVRLIDDLLEVSRISCGKIELRREQVELAAVIQSAVETSRPLIESAGHLLEISVPRHSLMVDADPVRLAQVFANLLNNAAKYTKRGGRIWLEVRDQSGEVVVSVRDTGIGLPAEAMPIVFEMFAQVHRSEERAQGGLGIGLSLVRSLVQMHGGAVEARSDGPGKGSEFIVRLPLAASPIDAPSTDQARSGPAALPPRRILVVDDNVDAADSLGMLLKYQGAQVDVVYSGQAALEAIHSHGHNVVLLDIGMPEMDGYEVARRIRYDPALREVVLIALTGWGQEEDRRRARAAGFNHHLIKPPDIGALQSLLASLEKEMAEST